MCAMSNELAQQMAVNVRNPKISARALTGRWKPEGVARCLPSTMADTGSMMSNDPHMVNQDSTNPAKAAVTKRI